MTSSASANNAPAPSPASAQASEPAAAAPAEIDYPFSSPESLDAYVAALSKPDPLDSRFAIFDSAYDWSKKKIPFVLCEFLAYKCALAYMDDQDVIQGILKSHRGVDPRTFDQTFAFFNSGDGGADTQGYGFLLGGAAFVIMRGTVGLTDWETDFDVKLTSDPELKNRLDLALIGPPAPARHHGFAAGWGAARKQVEAWVEHLPMKDAHPFVFSGHSLGGALAFLGAHEFKAKGRNVAAVVTFGAPMAGQEAFVKDYDERLGLKDRTIRFSSHEDAVPVVLAPFGYSHAGTPWLVDKRPMGKLWRMRLARFLGDFKSVESSQSEGDGKYWNFQFGGWNTNIDNNQPWMQKALAAFAFVLFVLAMKAFWAAGKGSVTAYRGHGVFDRYALYLSTLAYGQMRRLRPADYAQAYENFLRHLAYVRGSGEAFYAPLRGRPMKLLSVKAEKGYMAAYQNYIW